jgi:cell division protein FtsI/penicillin-binding protein 2
VGLDRAVQAAAEDAVETMPQQVALVAVAPSTGDVLAVAQNGPADTAGAIALTGRYPPGSTFKIITSTAALETLGLDGSSPQACPGATTIDGRVVPNENRFALGTVPLAQAFAKSCNTTFATLATQLAPDALPAAGRQLGFGADYRIPGLTTVTGSVPPAPDRVQRAEDGFGQGAVVATPFGMALVAATVAHGAPVVPQLVRGRRTEILTPATPPDQAALTQLRPMMRQVVTGGTATALSRSGEVYGKTGTAEYSAGGTNRAHGWFVGYRGDVAFAVLVVDGGSSGPAVGVAQRFLAALG